ncbi:MAG: 2-oxo acid dehydrogenase subunit E2 [Bdellovibrionales bacterium]|nr:2-oxo acid dehydrogenase subunit E2 [Bdellovibrionales bacterium]
MAIQEVKLPDIGEGVTEGELVKWLVKSGDRVAADQPVAEVLTDKATVEIPTPIAGVVKMLLRKEGDIIPIETAMLSLETGDIGDTEKVSSSSPAPKTPQVSSQSLSVSPMDQGLNVATGSVKSPGDLALSVLSASPDIYPPVADFRTLATPGTRRLARESGVDINNISGSGQLGRVTREDVVKAKNMTSGVGATVAGRPTVVGHVKESNIQRPSYQGPVGAPEERIPLRGIRKKIAENLQLAKQIVPHFTLMEEVDVTELVKFREQAKSVGDKVGVKVTYLPFVIKALIATIRKYPMFNASIDDAASEVVYKNYFNIGFAADTPNGLLVPVIKNANQKTILDLSREISELAGQARDGKLPLESMKGATITITNIGSVGGVYATPIINHPEVAILGMYKISDRPIWKNNQWVPAKFMNYTITCDHRLIDGAVAANFMRDFAARIESPSQLMLEMV